MCGHKKDNQNGDFLKREREISFVCFKKSNNNLTTKSSISNLQFTI